MSDIQTPRRPRGRPRIHPEKVRVKSDSGRPILAPAPGETAGDFLAAKPSALRALRLVESELDLSGRTTDGTERTALHVAAVAGLAEACRILLAAGADPHARDAWGRIPAETANSAIQAVLSATPEDAEESERGRMRVSLMRDIERLPLPPLREALEAWAGVIEKNENGRAK